MFGSSLSSGKGKDRPFHEHCDYPLELANHGVFHANQSLVYRRSLITTISDKVWDNLEDPDTQKWLRNFAQYSRKFRVNGLLAEVQTDWEDPKEILPPVEGIGQYNRYLT